MTSRDFCFWLQGFFEVGHALNAAIDPVKADLIKRHLALVFKHEIDPSMPGKDLDDIHAGKHEPKFGGVGPDGQVFRC